VGLYTETLAAELVDDKFAPAPLSETTLLAFQSRNLSDAPSHIQGDIPEWIQPTFETAFGDTWLAEAQALAERPTLDLRANILKATREKAVKALDRSGAQDAKIARYGIRIAAGEGASRLPNVTAELSFQKGWFEVQDEGSQIVADLVLPQEGDQVLDYCAGGGGKTLAFRLPCTTRARFTPMTPTASGWRRSSSGSSAPAPAMSRCMTMPRRCRASKNAATRCWSTRRAPAPAHGAAAPTPNGA
jgi:hypothetical protein